MSDKNIPVPAWLKSIVEDQVTTDGLGTSNKYTQAFLRKSLERQHLRGLLLQGAQSTPTEPVNNSFFEGLRSRVRRHGTK